jgi:serine phosphatase RsbU (regulator of sigma subunit)
MIYPPHTHSLIRKKVRMQHWIESHPGAGSHVSGDFASHVRLGPCRHAVIIGDVAGQGADAGNAACTLQAKVQTLVACSVSLTDVMYDTSLYFERTLCGEATPFASLFVGVIDDFEGVLRYASAGHEPALLFGMNGSHKHLDPTGPVIGIPAIPVYYERELPMSLGDMLVVVTDGITEARPPEARDVRFFGSSGVVRAVHAASHLGQDPARAICHAAIAHAGGRITDDATAVVAWLPSALKSTLSYGSAAAGGKHQRA